jgi:hypothetical protein
MLEVQNNWNIELEEYENFFSIKILNLLSTNAFVLIPCIALEMRLSVYE